MRILRHLPRGRWLLVFIALMLSSAVASARQIMQDTQCIVPADAVIEGTLIVLCDTLEIDGRVMGDVFGVGLRTTIRGQIDGSVYLAGFTLRHEGTIQRALHYVGIQLIIDHDDSITRPAVGGNAVVGVLRADLARLSRIAGSLFTAGYQWTIDGTIDGEINFWGSRLEINGVVRSPVYASVGDPASDGSQIRSVLLPFGFDIPLEPPGLVVGQTGLVVSRLEYSGPVEGLIEGTTLGAVEFRRIAPVVPVLDEPDTVVTYGREVLREFSVLLALGVIGWVLLPQFWTRPMITLRVRPIHSFSFGLLTFILSFPLVFILLLLTGLLITVLLIIGLDGVAGALGLLLLVLNLSAAGAFYFVAIYLSRVLTSWAIGRFLLRSVRADMTPRAYALASLALGALLIAVLVSLPAVGWIINALALFFGLGAVLVVLLDQVQQWRGVTPPPPAPFPAVSVYGPAEPVEEAEPSGPALPPHLLEAPGMENLPPGFDPERFFRD
ncbi:MAG: hypothetical protein SNJ80_14795 [Anaerolinea sp.]